MERTKKPLYGWFLGVATLIFSALSLELGPHARLAFAQTSGQSDPALLPESSWPPTEIEQIEIKDDALLPEGKTKIPTALARKVLEHFLAELPTFLENLKVDSHREYEALSETLQAFLDSPEFSRAVVHSQRSKDPLEFPLWSPERLKESGMIREFSKAFNLPLQFERTHAIVHSMVRVSFTKASGEVLVQVKFSEREIIYVVDPSNGSILGRYEKTLQK